jgi:hypothetical protein
MSAKLSCVAMVLAAMSLTAGLAQPVWGQNVVAEGGLPDVRPAVALPREVALQAVTAWPQLGGHPTSEEGQRIASKLDTHVQQLLEEFPYRPFHHTLGISGIETSFDHPDELFHALSLAYGWLSDEVRAEIRNRLERELQTQPPYVREGYDPTAGMARERYQVPEHLRLNRRQEVADAFGVYALWMYTQHVAERPLPPRHYTAVRERVVPLLEARERQNDGEAVAQLNGDIAGLIGLARLARGVGDSETENRAVDRLRVLLEERVNLERTDSRVIVPSRAATKSLHHFKTPRYNRLTPELGQILAETTDGLAVRRLRAIREPRPGWHLAFGDRFIGGENYTNPLDFPWGLFLGSALIEETPAESLAAWVDVPWCRGDLAFIEKCAWTLWVEAGRPWHRESVEP